MYSYVALGVNEHAQHHSSTHLPHTFNASSVVLLCTFFSLLMHSQKVSQRCAGGELLVNPRRQNYEEKVAQNFTGSTVFLYARGGARMHGRVS